MDDDELIPLDFRILVDKVRKLNVEAAAYLESKAYRDSDAFTGYGRDVNSSVCWIRTPQGRKFWETLYIQMGEDYNNF